MGFKQFITQNLRLINWNNNLFVNKYRYFKINIIVFFIVLFVYYGYDKITFLFFIRCANPVFEFHNTGVIQKEIRNQLELPLKPKKPNPPFFQFLQEKRAEVLEKHDLKYKGKHFNLMLINSIAFKVLKNE